MTAVVVRSRIIARSPGSWSVRSSRPLPDETETQTMPTGFSGVPPPGPAMPVMPTPTSAPNRPRAPSARATATSGETAPTRAINDSGTSASATLASFEYTTTPPSTYSDEPARSVSRPAISPPVQDSATATVRTGGPRSSPATISSIVEPSRENTVAPWRSSSAASNASYASHADDGKTVATSSSPRRRQVVISSDDVSTESPRSVRASSDSGIPIIRMIRCSSESVSSARTAGVRTASAHIGCSSPGGPGSTTTGGRPSPDTTSPGAVPTGSSTTAPSGTRACLRAPARIPSSDASRHRRRIRATICQIRSSSAGSTDIGRPANPATTSAVRSSAVGPSPPDVMIRSIRSEARNSSAARTSEGRSPTTITCASETPAPRSCSASHGPLASRMIPESTSVPVTTMPARALTTSSRAARPPTAGGAASRAGSRTRSGRRSPPPRRTCR